MAAGSMRETIKVLTSTFSGLTVPYPLPEELRQSIESFLERYHDIEDHDSQRFHDDLLSLYTKQVADSSEKRGAFLGVLRLVRPAITGQARLDEWWGLLLRPTVEELGRKSGEVEDAKQILQSILVFDGDEDKQGDHARLSSHFLQKVISDYLSRTRIPSSMDDVVSPEDEFVSRQLESILVAFGRRKPKELLLALDGLFVQTQYRFQALNLLSTFVRLQPPHLYLVLETSLIQHLEKCLLIETSSTIIELALMILIMFLPHIAGSLPSDHHLAKLFLIYSRLLCWDKFGTPVKTNQADQGLNNVGDVSSAYDAGDSEQPWDRVQHNEDYPDTSPPTLIHYFTFLYGLFPLNFMSFIRKPRKFLKSLNFPGAQDFDLDQDLIHSRTEPYRRDHLLHPNMFTTTIEDELSENKWLKSDPADIVTECMDLCVAVSETLNDPGPPPTSKLPDLPIPPTPEAPRADMSLDDDGTTAHDSSVSWRNTQSTMFGPSATSQLEPFDVPSRAKSVKSTKSVSPLLKAADVLDSPVLRPVRGDKKQDMLGAPLLTPQTPLTSSNRLGTFAQNVSAGSHSPTHSEFQNQSMASLQREIMLLRNDLNFERYLKQQHLTHIGQLQRKHIKEATAEADTQNLINTNRTLKAKLAKANELYAQLKKETLTSRSQSKKWESELSSRVRSYREESKIWHGDEDNIRFELQQSQSNCENLKKLIEKAEAEQLKAQQRTRALEFELEDYANVRRQLEAVQEKVVFFEDQTKQLNALIKERNELRNDLEAANMRLSSRELERERSIKAYERRIMELESRLQAADKVPGKPGQLPSSVQQMLDSALAASNSKLQQMKKTHYRLLERYTELEMRCHDLEGQRQADFGRTQAETRDYRDPEKEALARNLSTRKTAAYNPKHLPPIQSNLPPIRSELSPEDYDFYDYHSPVSINSPTSANWPARPSRIESLPTKRQTREPTTIGPNPDFSATYDATLNAQLQAPRVPETVSSSAKSTRSVETSSSKGEKKDKVAPKSEVRVYGRGGAQNIGKKTKEKEEKKAASSRSGGFRGLKGIM